MNPEGLKTNFKVPKMVQHSSQQKNIPNPWD